jgi:hypothetical protein
MSEAFEAEWESHANRDWRFKDLAKHFYLAATERKDDRIAELEQEVERITDIIKSIPCAGCEIADGSHFSDCPKYTTEWIMEAIAEQALNGE